MTFLLFFVTPLRAAPPVTSAQLTRARSLFAEANTLYTLAKYRAALQHYEEVYKLVPRPSALFNIANCYRHLEKSEKALLYYKRFMKEWTTQNPGRTVPELQIARQHIKALERTSAQAKPAVSPSSPRSVVNAPASPSPSSPSSGKGRRRTLTLVPSSPSSPPPPRVSPSSTPIYKRWWFWTLIGVAVAGGATAVGIAATSGSSDRVPRGQSVDWSRFGLGVGR